MDRINTRIRRSIPAIAVVVVVVVPAAAAVVAIAAAVVSAAAGVVEVARHSVSFELERPYFDTAMMIVRRPNEHLPAHMDSLDRIY